MRLLCADERADRCADGGADEFTDRCADERAY